MRLFLLVSIVFLSTAAHADPFDAVPAMTTTVYAPTAPQTSRARLHAPMDIRSRPQIVAEAARYIGSRNPTGFRGPWCKAYVNMIARKAGHYVHASLRARDTGAMGKRIAGPVPGAYRVTRHHVSIVAEVRDRAVIAISGNNGRGRVGWSRYSVGGAAYYAPI